MPRMWRKSGFRSLRSAVSGLARLSVGGQRATARAVASKWSRRLDNTSHLTHHNMSSGYGLTGGMCDHSQRHRNSNWTFADEDSSSTATRPRPLLSLLAGDARLLRRQHKLRRRLGQEKVRPYARGLLRVPTPPQRGTIYPVYPPNQQPFLTQHQQAARVHALQSAYRKHLAANPRDDAPTAGQIRSLGLIEGDLHSKDMKAAALLPHVKTN
jgi:hypothetical protein